MNTAIAIAIINGKVIPDLNVKGACLDFRTKTIYNNKRGCPFVTASLYKKMISSIFDRLLPVVTSLL